MTLCNIGNTNATFLKDGIITRLKISDFKNYKPEEKVFFISVNDEVLSFLKISSVSSAILPFGSAIVNILFHLSFRLLIFALNERLTSYLKWHF